MTIHQLQISGFKSIHAETIALGRVNCFIGANGVVDDEALLRRGVRAGLPRLFKSSFASERTPSHIGVGVESAQGAAYRVSLLNPLESPEPAWSYKTEVLSDGSEEIVSDGVRNKKNLNPKAGLAALRLVEVAPTNPAAQLMQVLQQYAIYCPNTPTLRGIVPDTQPRSPVGLSGGQLAEAFAALRQRYANADGDAPTPLDELLELIDWVAEGPTDYEIINAALNALLPAPFKVTLLQPEATQTSFGNGWGGVLKWCHAASQRHSGALMQDPTLSLFDVPILHLDADVAAQTYAHCGPAVEAMAQTLAWGGLAVQPALPTCRHHLRCTGASAFSKESAKPCLSTACAPPQSSGTGHKSRQFARKQRRLNKRCSAPQEATHECRPNRKSHPGPRRGLVPAAAGLPLPGPLG